jgi:DNA-binding response OmpR family regulator
MMKDLKVLLVDDEEEFIKALSERLQMRDLHSDTVFDGEQALDFVKDKEEPDVMVLDLRMPGIDGIEVLRQVKKAYPKIEVIILTGHGTEKEEEEARRLGAFDYLQKPVNIDVLANRVKSAYRRKMEKAMMAANSAEAGVFDTAKDVLKEENDD